jgi:hypothetical protein
LVPNVVRKPPNMIGALLAYENFRRMHSPTDCRHSASIYLRCWFRI